MSVFETYRVTKAYPYRFAGTLQVGVIVGGTPYNPEVAKAWLKKKLGVESEDLLQEMVAEIMVQMNTTAEKALQEAHKRMGVNGFKRDEKGLYIEGRQLKAAIKEAASVAMAVGKIPQHKWGNTSKQLLGFLAEHVVVVEDRLYLGVEEPTGINQRFVHTFRGSAITYEEYVEDASIDFTIMSDYDFTEENYAAIWTTGEQQGIGASRSQGFGRYEVTRWDAVSAAVAKRGEEVNLDAQCEDEIQRAYDRMERQMDQMQERYENQIQDLKEEVYELKALLAKTERMEP